MKTGKIALAALACAAAAAMTPALADTVKPAFGNWGVDLSSMDRSVKPGDDFFQYVNGNWLKTAEIPGDRTSTGSFQDLLILSEKRMKDIAGDIEAKPYASLTPEEKQLRDLYDAYIDTKAIDAAGLAPAKHDLDYFAHLKTLTQVAQAMASPSRPADSIFGNGIAPDAKNSNIYVLTLGPAGLGMPDRDYYLRDDKALATTRDAYRAHLAKMLTLGGYKNADARAQAVYNLEVEIAKAHWPAADRRDADKNYNPMKISELVKFAPGFPWVPFFKAEGVTANGPKGERTVIVRQNTAFPTLAKLFAATPVAVWRDYLAVHYLDNMAAYLPTPIDDEHFAFYGKVLGGQDKQLDRQTRAVHLLDARLGHPLGKIYVARYFPPESETKVEQLISNLLKAYDADIRTIPWMTEVTRQKALDKLHQFTPHVGYPDKWRDYSGLTIKRDDLVGDIERSGTFEWNYRLARMDDSVDRNEWFMTPPTINAYYT